MFGRIVQAGLR